MTVTAPVPEPPVGKLLYVRLIPQAEEALAAVYEREHLGDADVASRAIILYEFITRMIAEGRDILVRDKDMTQQLVRLL